jgi:hypothetical protein
MPSSLTNGPFAQYHYESYDSVLGGSQPVIGTYTSGHANPTASDMVPAFLALGPSSQYPSYSTVSSVRVPSVFQFFTCSDELSMKQVDAPNGYAVYTPQGPAPPATSSFTGGPVFVCRFLILFHLILLFVIISIHPRHHPTFPSSTPHHPPTRAVPTAPSIPNALILPTPTTGCAARVVRLRIPTLCLSQHFLLTRLTMPIRCQLLPHPLMANPTTLLHSPICRVMGRGTDMV